jgi:hypothetical protein
MKAYGGVHVQIHVLLTSALVGGEWSASRPGCFTPWGRDPGTHWKGGWVGPRTSLDAVEKILDPTGTRTPTPLSSPQPNRATNNVQKVNKRINIPLPQTFRPYLLMVLLYAMHIC